MLARLTEPAEEVVSLEGIKAYLRVDHNADDELIGMLLAASREAVEMRTGRALVRASYRYAPHVHLRAPYWLPLWPAEVTRVSHIVDGDLVDATEFVFDADRGYVTDLPHGVRDLIVEFTTEPVFVPGPLKHAVTLRVQAAYEAAPDEKAVLIDAADRLCDPYRLDLGV